ncbi:hypothetical protein [Sphingomonas sp. OV641]|uniref:hypothetical protein n=1 Tax=Sphingomonas sp. OV641 TaxID=1881068 RepID=UPI00115FD527|nr:hypothetical protein [Sphingomonas sp. OV641]
MIDRHRDLHDALLSARRQRRISAHSSLTSFLLIDLSSLREAGMLSFKEGNMTMIRICREAGEAPVATIHGLRLLKGDGDTQIASIDNDKVYGGSGRIQLLYIAGDRVFKGMGSMQLARFDRGKVYAGTSGPQLATFVEGQITDDAGAVIGHIDQPLTAAELAAVLHLVFAIF